MLEASLKKYSVLFLIAACWNLAGAIPGYFDPVNTFGIIFNKELVDPLMIAIYKGGWGTTLLYFFGYLMVAYNPYRHTAVVILGLIGKLFFAFMLLNLYLSGLANSLVFVVIVGDSIFIILFLLYLNHVRSLNKGII